MGNVTANLAEIRACVAAAAERSGRGPGEVELMVVSKTWPAVVVREAVEAGQRLFGENKVQELVGKAGELPADLRWHLIGHLQRNKVRKVLPIVESIHSIDSERLAGHCSVVAEELGVRPKIYLEVNLGREESKHGFLEGDLPGVVERIAGLVGLEVAGLMCIPPDEADPERARSWFRKLRELRDRLVESTGVALAGLSMGMSHDYEVAVEEGSTMVRVGSAVFGDRVVEGGPA